MESQRVIELETKVASLSEYIEHLNKQLIDISYKNNLYENMIGDLRFRLGVLERSTNEIKGRIEPPREEEPREVARPYPTAYEKHENRRIPPRYVPNKGHNEQERCQPPQERRQPPQERRQRFQGEEQENGNRQQRQFNENGRFRKDFQRRNCNRPPKNDEQEQPEPVKTEEAPEQDA